MYYIYRHIRNDLQEPFYIGIGTCDNRYKSNKKYYVRAFRKGKRDRSHFWHNIVNKTDYEVEIIFENVNLELIKEKETEFILLYGRKDLNTGTLVNMSMGREGNHITSISDAAKINMKDAAQKSCKTGFLSPYGKHVFVYDSDGKFITEFGSISTCSKTLNIPSNKISEIMKGHGPLYSYNKMVFYNTFKGYETLSPIIGNQKIKKPINLYDKNMNLIKTYSGIKDAALDNDLCIQTIGRLCKTLKISRWDQYFRYSEKGLVNA